MTRKRLIKVYVGEDYFRQCHYTLLGIIKDDKQLERNQLEYKCIDEAIDNLEKINTPLSPNQEFIAQCSNFEAWANHSYNTNILTYQLSFPLLRELTKKGDPIAKKRFKEEIIKRINSHYFPVIIYLLNEKYLEVFNKEEIDTLLQSLRSSNKNKYINLLINKRKYLQHYYFKFRPKKDLISSEKIAIIDNTKGKTFSYMDYKKIVSFKERGAIPRIRYERHTYYDFHSIYSKFKSNSVEEEKVRNLLSYTSFWRVANILDKNDDILIYVPRKKGVFKFHSKTAGFDIIILPTTLSEKNLKHKRYLYKKERQRIREEKKKEREKKKKLQEILDNMTKKTRGTNFYIDKSCLLGGDNTLRIVLRNREETNLLIKEDIKSIKKIESALEVKDLSVSIVWYINEHTMTTTSLYYISFNEN
jgi:hypothetical protein